MLGLVYALPMAAFWRFGFFDKAMKMRSLAILSLFGVQAGLGWWMVKSGLEDKEYEGRASVDPVRLLVH